jgi:hypothetical protein
MKNCEGDKFAVAVADSRQAHYAVGFFLAVNCTDAVGGLTLPRPGLGQLDQLVANTGELQVEQLAAPTADVRRRRRINNLLLNQAHVDSQF